MEYQLIRSRRRTLAICIGRDGSVVVHAPLRMAQNTIDTFVSEKQNWIREKSEFMTARAQRQKNFCITAGSKLLLLGREYPVVYGENTAFDGSQFILCGEDTEAQKRKLVQLYQSLAQSYIPQRVACFSQQTGWTASGIRIGSANTAWGSCSGKNKLNFTWKLIMAEPALIDYVVVHELAHTVEHNHSARFWRLVERVLPDYKERRSKLRQLASCLQNQGWG